MDLTNLNGTKKRNGRKVLDLSTTVYGKVPPQARDLEEAILGAIMLNKTAFEEAFEVVKTANAFYVDAHQRIFAAMQRLNKKGGGIDMLTVVEELRKTEELDLVGGPFYVTKLTNAVSSSAHIEDHSRIVFQKYIQREIIRVGSEMISEAYEDSTDAFDLLDKVETDVFAISNHLHRGNLASVDGLLVRAIQQIEDKRNMVNSNAAYVSGVPSGFSSIDRLTFGWQPTDLIILAARPSVGKTAYALNLARNAAKNIYKPTPTAFFSLEMSASQLMQRLLSSESEIPLEKITKGRMEEFEMEQLYQRGVQKLSGVPLFIDDTPALNIFELRAKCRRLKSAQNIGLIIIDYIQLMSGTGENRNSNREQEISTISRSLKALAKELEVPIIALSQLSREVEKRAGDKMPVLSDLRESGAIEQDADTVIFIYRPEYHNIHKNGTGESNVGETHLRFAKHRMGMLDTVKMRAQLWIQKFIEWEEEKTNWNSPIYNGNGLNFKNVPGQPIFSQASKFNGQIDDDEKLPF